VLLNQLILQKKRLNLSVDNYPVDISNPRNQLPRFRRLVSVCKVAFDTGAQTFGFANVQDFGLAVFEKVNSRVGWYILTFEV
jgi:hypothetical protein